MALCSGVSVQKTRNINVFLVGLAFLLVFTAFQTMSNLQTVVIDSAKNPNSTGYVEGFTGNSYVSLGTLSNFLSMVVRKTILTFFRNLV